jgi:uncharacterized membrane protein
LFLVGVAGVAGFVYTELFLLRTVCPLCTVTNLAGLAIFALSAASLRSRYALPPNARWATAERQMKQDDGGCTQQGFV